VNRFEISSPREAAPDAFPRSAAADPASWDAALDLRATAALLRDAFPIPAFASDAYLRWLYHDNPCGAAIVGNVDDDRGERVAHLGLVPQIWRSPDRNERFLLALNAVHAVRKYVRQERVRTRRDRPKRTLASLAAGLYEQAAGVDYLGVFGVPNARSTHSFVHKQGFRLIRPLPVRACLPLPPWRGKVDSFEVDASFRQSERFDAIVAGLDELPVDRWVQQASAAWLRWRLSRPLARYALHRGPRGIAISTEEARAGSRFAVILRLYPRTDTGWAGGGRILANDLVYAACKFHRTPFAVYAGFNRHMTVWGIPVPRRYLPAPLNLSILSLQPKLDQAHFDVDTYEFLDGDQY
jgi:hypothetical protein